VGSLNGVEAPAKLEEELGLAPPALRTGFTDKEALAGGAITGAAGAAVAAEEAATGGAGTGAELTGGVDDPCG